MQLTDKQKEILAVYGHMFWNTGGNDLVNLLEREDLNMFSNAIGANIQSSCRAQLVLLEELDRLGLLHRPNSPAY